MEQFKSPCVNSCMTSKRNEMIKNQRAYAKNTVRQFWQRREAGGNYKVNTDTLLYGNSMSLPFM